MEIYNCVQQRTFILSQLHTSHILSNMETIGVKYQGLVSEKKRFHFNVSSAENLIYSAKFNGWKADEYAALHKFSSFLTSEHYETNNKWLILFS